MINPIKLQAAKLVPYIFTFSLAFSGGFADAASFLKLGVFTGQLTGNTVTCFVYVMQGNYTAFITCLMALAGFITGMAVGIIWRRNLKNKQLMYLPLVIELIIIILVTLILKIMGDIQSTQYFLIIGFSAALGLQNGMYNKVLGVSIHSSFMTGTTGSWLESLLYTDKLVEDQLFKRNIFFTVLAAFILGVITAAVLTHYFAINAFLVLIICMFISTIICKQYWQLIAV